MDLSTKLKWELRQGYIITLIKAGVNQKWLQHELQYLTNDNMADLIKGMIKLGVIK